MEVNIPPKRWERVLKMNENVLLRAQIRQLQNELEKKNEEKSPEE